MKLMTWLADKCASHYATEAPTGGVVLWVYCALFSLKILVNALMLKSLMYHTMVS